MTHSKSSTSSFWLLASGLTVLFILSLPAVTARIYASDEVEGFSWLHSFAFDRDVSFENEYRYFYDSGQVKNPGFHDTFLSHNADRQTAIGRQPNFTTMGAAMLWAPFYAAGHVAALVSGRPADGLSQPYITAVAIGSATYGFLALLLSIAIARRVVGTLGLGPALAVWLGTPLLFYMYVTPIFTHACSAFAVSLLLWTWLRVRDRWTPAGAFALGITGGLVMIVRSQDALFIAAPAIDFLRWAMQRSLRPSGRGAPGPDGPGLLGPWARGLWPVLSAALGAALILGPQLLAFKALNGHYRQSEFETRKMSWTSPHGLQVLFDHQHGLFFWTPLAVLAAAGLLWLSVRKPTRWIGALMLIGFALQAYIAGAVESWTVAGAYGQRRFVSLTPLLVLGVAALATAMATAKPLARAAAVAAVVLCVWWNIGLMAQFGLHTMDRERLTLADNAWQSFVALPRAAPSLIWRYLTDRSSFYNQPRH